MIKNKLKIETSNSLLIPEFVLSVLLSLIMNWLAVLGCEVLVLRGVSILLRLVSEVLRLVWITVRLVVIACLRTCWLRRDLPIAVRIVLIIQDLNVLSSHPELLNLPLCFFIKVNNFFILQISKVLPSHLKEESIVILK